MDIRSFFDSPKKLLFILLGSIGLLVLLTIFLVIGNLGGESTEEVTIEFWGVFDEEGAYKAAIDAFEAANSNVTIEYRTFSFADYEKEVIDALAAGGGPDMWLIHHTWLAEHKDKLQPMPALEDANGDPLMNVSMFRQQFVDVAATDLVSGNDIYALPLYVDTLALYYNRDLFNTAGIAEPPDTWAEFNQDVELLTKLDEQGNLIQSAAAIGSADNVNRSTDLLMSLMIQSGARMTNSDNTEATFASSVENLPVGEQALQFYTDYTNSVKTTYTWNDQMPYSIDAFIDGKAAMMFNYSHQIDAIRERSPRLNFAVASTPQISLSNIRTYASYFAPAVSAKATDAVSQNAWRFLAYLSSTDGVKSYLAATKRPTARRDLVDAQRTDPDLGVFATQALSARSWYQIDAVAIASIFADMINSVNLGRATVREALENAEAKVTTLMSRR